MDRQYYDQQKKRTKGQTMTNKTYKTKDRATRTQLKNRR